MTLDPIVYLQHGYGRGKIAHISKEEGLNVSERRITNIIQAYCAFLPLHGEQLLSLQQQQPQPQQQSELQQPQPQPQALSGNTNEAKVQDTIKSVIDINAPSLVVDESEITKKSVSSVEDEGEDEDDDNNDNEEDDNSDFEEQQRSWDEAWRSRMLKTIFQEKRERQLELSLIEQEKRKLDQQKRQIEKTQHDLEIKESKFVKYEPLIPSVKELMDMGITFDLILPYIETIREKAVLENMDSSKAAYNLTLELRNYRQLGGTERAIELANTG